MNSECFATNILMRLEEKIFPEGRTGHAKRLIARMDNCSIHRSGATEDYIKQNNVMRLRHPPYAPGFAPSDFYLFPSIKEKLKNIRIVEEDALFHRLQELLNEIPIKELRKAFDTCINRLLDVSQGDGGDIS
jgi:transposase